MQHEDHEMSISQANEAAAVSTKGERTPCTRTQAGWVPETARFHKEMERYSSNIAAR